MNIYLIGFMGSGKSTIAKLLAKRLNWSFIDMDAIIEKQQGKSIGEIFASVGEDIFRKMEHELLQGISNQYNNIVSCGGGVPCFHNNMELMNSNGTTVYLKLSSNALVDRLLTISVEARQARPLLANKTPQQLLDYVNDTLTKREPFYNQASLIVLCDNLNVSQTIDRVERSLAMGGFI